MDDKTMVLPFEYDRIMETRKWVDAIPYINFPNNWNIKIIPPFAGASIRFIVRQDKGNVSIYLDCYDRLGYFGSPYWEIYPNEEDDNQRFDILDTENLLKYIQQSLDKQNENK